MCGIAGYVLHDPPKGGAEILFRMLRAIRHRGPDDEGIVLAEPEAGVRWSFRTEASAPAAPGDRLGSPAQAPPHRIAIGHGRFSIIDLSVAAHQPFWTRDGGVCVAFNGEIYNYVEVRSELSRLGHAFHTDSDTEVLAEAYREWGVRCFERLNGFWALTLFDAREGRVLLSRDRIGKAPLYLARRGHGLFWCSEIRGLRAALGDGAFPVNPQAVDDFVRGGWRDVFDSTLFEGIETFPAASHAWVEPDGRFEPTRFWSVPRGERLAERAVGVPDAAAELRTLLADAVRIRLRADVPVGLDLSGGLDSSSIVALATAAPRSGALRVFTVSYPGSPFDESSFARAVADVYRDSIEYTVLEPTNQSILEGLDELVDRMHEPFHDPQIANHREIWCRMREEGIRVSLNGAAGDEVLAGYGSDYLEPYLRHLFGRGRLVRFFRELFGYTEHERHPFGLQYLRTAYHLLPRALRPYHNPAMDVPANLEPYLPPAGIDRRLGPSREIEERLLDTMTQWRMNYWCRMGNQNSMSVPLEFRCPFLDYRLVEFAFRLPLGFLIRDGWMKWLLRVAMRDDLPREIAWRRQKGGFRYPLAERLPECKEELLRMLEGMDCPHVDLGRLRMGYDEINRRNPTYLWRLLSFSLWWKRCVEGKRLAAG